MQYLLPKVDWQSHGWNKTGQIDKIHEEVDEVMQALAEGDPVEVVKETLDMIQTGWTLISMVLAENDIDLGQLFKEHHEKLKSKGYLKEGE